MNTDESPNTTHPRSRQNLTAPMSVVQQRTQCVNIVLSDLAALETQWHTLRDAPVPPHSTRHLRRPPAGPTSARSRYGCGWRSAVWPRDGLVRFGGACILWGIRGRCRYFVERRTGAGLLIIGWGVARKSGKATFYFTVRPLTAWSRGVICSRAEGAGVQIHNAGSSATIYRVR